MTPNKYNRQINMEMAAWQKINVLPLTSQCMDLNPTENLWSELQREELEISCIKEMFKFTLQMTTHVYA